MSGHIPEPAMLRESVDVDLESVVVGVDFTEPSAAAAAVEQGERDDVFETSIESFPASDPPGWISMWLGPPASIPRPLRTDEGWTSAVAIRDAAS
jgi:hypothetical protein